MTDGPTVSVVIPTFRRPASLARALESVFSQRGVAAGWFDVVVVDNDPERSACPVVEEARTRSSCELIYLSAPEPGVSNARNLGVAQSRGAFIAFLDDDEEAEAEWLCRLAAVQARFVADVVFGPVEAEVPAAAPHAAYLKAFFSRRGPEASGPLQGYFGCGNSFLRREALPHPTAPFSAARNRIGGEDDLLFSTMQAAGARFAWAADAAVREHPEPSRLTLAYTLKRAFAFGQGPASACWAAGASRWPLIPLWMGWGLAQAAGFGVAAAMDWMGGDARRAVHLDRAARGLGKALWFPPFKIAFYGS